MLKVKAGIAFVFTLAAPMNAVAQSSCPSPTLAEVHAKGVFENALLRAKAIGREKGEFETTEAYQARMAKAASVIAPTGFLTFPWIAYSNGFSFDADKGVVTYDSSTLDTSCAVNLSTARYGLGRPYCVEQTASVVRGPAKVMGNAFGAKVMVSPVHERRVGIALGPDRQAGSNVPGLSTDRLFQFHASIAEAQSLKRNGVIVVRATPKAPLYIEGSHYSGATIDSPQETYGQDYLLVGDISCLSIADAVSGKVYQTIGVGSVNAGKGG